VPKQPTKGTKQFNVELSSELIDEFKRFCESRGESASHNAAVALRRHMANPPPQPHTVPLPDSPPVPEEAKKPRGRRKK
jgi:hypothetical protein